MGVCDCSILECGAPPQFKLSVSGITGCGATPCDDCGDIDGDYILDMLDNPTEGCQWFYPDGEIDYICGVGVLWLLTITRNTDCSYHVKVTFYVAHDAPWEADIDCDELLEEITLTGGPGCFDNQLPEGACEFPTSVTLQALGMSEFLPAGCVSHYSMSPEGAGPKTNPPPLEKQATCGVPDACIPK